MDAARQELIETARALVTEMSLGDGNSAGGVGAAIRTVDGNVHTGVCIDLGSGLGFCAEVAAMAQMVTKRETQIDAVVAVTFDRILAPCGRCRETMTQIDPRNIDCTVIVSETEDVQLRDLLPNHRWTRDESHQDG
ncbi:cytidine deaminase [Candidatus Bipolaricaulota bacterium]